MGKTTASTPAKASGTPASVITSYNLHRSGPPPQKPPTKSSYDTHTRQLLLALSQSQTGSDTATYEKLSDENARLVRRSLGRTVRALERRQERKKKSKSSGVAADALEFYRYALVKSRKIRGVPVDEEEDLEEEELVGDSSDEDSDVEGDSSEEDESSEEESSDDDSSSSANSEEFLNAHNDLCEVCNGVGDADRPLLCCATCTLVFHQKCHRPILVKEPPDTWSCAYCDDSGVTLHKRDSRERKRAARGVREMRKMTEELATAADGVAGEDKKEEGSAPTTPARAKARTSPGTSPSSWSARDPTTGRFLTREKIAALEAEAEKKKEKQKDEGQKMEDQPPQPQDLSDLTAEEIDRLSSPRKEKVETVVGDEGDEGRSASLPAPRSLAAAAGAEEAAATATAAASTATTETVPPTTLTPPKKDVSPRSKHQLKGAELRLLLDTMSPEDVDISGPRSSRRQRKAPALYDPGDMGGDSEWKSPGKGGGGEASAGKKTEEVGNKKRKRELLVGKRSSGKDRDAKRRRKEERRRKREAKKKAKKKQKKTKTKRKKVDKSALPPYEREGASCHMCYDDDRVDVCLFCACRICFSKGDTESTLLCDTCDAEYHTYCLDPPLASMPKDDEEWFCPACTNIEIKKAKAAADRKAAAERKAAAQAASPKNGKQGTPKSASKSPAKAQQQAVNTATTTPRKRALQSSKKAKEQAETDALIAKRARTSGRLSPRGGVQVQAAVAASGGGRKSPPATLPASVAMPGIPPNQNAAMLPTQQRSPTQRSRSGRKVKRTPFHDEIEQGVQHLASSLRSVGETGNLPLHKMTPEEAEKARAVFEQEMLKAGIAMPAAKPAATSAAAGATNRPHIASLPQAVEAVPTQGQKATPAAAAAAAPRALPETYPPASIPGVPSAMSPKKALSIAVPKPPPGGPAAAASAWGPGSPFPYVYTPHPKSGETSKTPRRKPGARECMQIVRRFGVNVIPEKHVGILVDYCNRGKVEHLVRMRERLDDHERFLQLQIAELELLIKKKGEIKVTVPPQLARGAAVGLASSAAASPRGPYSGIPTPRSTPSSPMPPTRNFPGAHAGAAMSQPPARKPTS